VHFISVGGSPKKREGWGMYIPHPSLFFGRFNSFETHPINFALHLAGCHGKSQRAMKESNGVRTNIGIRPNTNAPTTDIGKRTRLIIPIMKDA
jgi:hypothetical protein